MNLSIPCIDVRTAEEQSRTAQAYLLDVRGFDEFASGHAEGAVCIPLPVLEQRLTELPTDQPVLVMCQSGGRSAQAVEQLQMWGLSQVLNVEGGVRRMASSRITHHSGNQHHSAGASGTNRGGDTRTEFFPAGLFAQSGFFLGGRRDWLPAHPDRNSRRLPNDVGSPITAVEPHFPPYSIMNW